MRHQHIEAPFGQSKYPPVKPGVLICEPPKAV
jgi:hypothetical protein